MNLKIYTLEQAEDWDSAVAGFQAYDVYYLSGYVKAFRLHGDGEPLLFYYDDGKIRGINVVMKRDIADDPHFSGKIPRDTYFDFATPYGYGGWLVEGEGDPAPLFREYEQWNIENHITSEFVRFHPILHNQAMSAGHYHVIPLGHTVSMDLSSPQVIWSNITSKNRNVIRKAEKNGVKIYRAQNPDIYEVFRSIYNGTMDKDHAADYYYFSEQFYSSILEDLPNHAQVFYAQIPDGTVIAASIILAANGRLTYHLSGSLREYQHLAPTNLLLYKAALWGCANGCRTFHLGGGVGCQEDSLFKFKKAFFRGDELKEFAVGKRIFCREAYDELLNIRSATDQDFDHSAAFFPQYRA